MGYAPVSDGFYSHVKVQLLGRDQDALTLWLLALTWVTQQGTDGEVPLLVARTLCGRRADRWAAALVKVGLWEETPHGFRFHDFLDWQKSRHELYHLRNKKRYAGSLGGKRSGEARAQAVASRLLEAKTNPLLDSTLLYSTKPLLDSDKAPVDNSAGAASPTPRTQAVAPATGPDSNQPNQDTPAQIIAAVFTTPLAQNGPTERKDEHLARYNAYLKHAGLATEPT